MCRNCSTFYRKSERVLKDARKDVRFTDLFTAGPKKRTRAHHICPLSAQNTQYTVCYTNNLPPSWSRILTIYFAHTNKNLASQTSAKISNFSKLCNQQPQQSTKLFFFLWTPLNNQIFFFATAVFLGSLFKIWSF